MKWTVILYSIIGVEVENFICKRVTLDDNGYI